MAEPIYGSTFEEDFAARRRMLPQAMGAATSLTDDVGGLPAARARLRQIEDRLAAAEAQEPDLNTMQEFARRQGEMGQGALLNALAAQYAGEGFQPLQAKFLRRAEAAQQPLRVGTTMITPTGEVMRDPYSDRQRNIENLRGQVGRAATDVRLVETAQERIRAERERQQERDERRAEREAENRKNALLIAAMRAASGGGRGGAGAQASTGEPVIPASPYTRIIQPDINLHAAMGARGVAENAFGRLANMVGGGDPNDAGRNATAQLGALHTQTLATMSGIFSGKESVHLLKILDQHAIKPNELFGGVAAVAPKAKANIAILQDAARRLDEGIAINTTPAQKAKLQQGRMQIQSLISDYQTLLSAAEKQIPTAAPQIAPRGQPAAATGGRLTPAEEQELAALRARFGKQP